MTALREKHFGEAKVSAKDFEGWKPDEVHEVNATTREYIDIKCLPSILVIGIYQILNSRTDGGDFISTKLNDIFDFPVVSSQLICCSLMVVI